MTLEASMSNQPQLFETEDQYGNDIIQGPKIIKEKGDEDSEHRIFYVGATRARKTLHIVEPKDKNGYEL